MEAPSVPSASKTKRRYNEAFHAEEPSGANENKCKSIIKQVYVMVKNCKTQQDQRTVLSTINDSKRISCDYFNQRRPRLLSNEQIKHRNDFIDRSSDLENEENENKDIAIIQENLFWNDVLNSQMTSRSSCEKERKIDSDIIDSPIVPSASNDDVICVFSPSQSQLCVTNQQNTTSPFSDIESKQEQLFWKDVTDAFKNPEHNFQVADEPLTLLKKDVSKPKEQNTVQSMNKQNPRPLVRCKYAFRRNNSRRVLHQTDEVICIDSDESDDDEHLLSSKKITSPRNKILPTQDINYADIESRDIENTQESQFWQQIEDAFDNQDNIFWKDSESAFQNRILTGFVVNKTHIDPYVFFDDCKKIIAVKINTHFKKTTALRLNAVFVCECKIIKNQNEIFKVCNMHAEASKVYKNDDFNCWYFESFRDPILAKFFEHQERDSGWTLSAIIHLKIIITPIIVLQGNSYIEAPKEIRLRKGCVNVKNEDNACFKWAVLSALYTNIKQACRVSSYQKYNNVLNFNGIQFPMKIHQIPCFEKQNNISINVFILKLNTDPKRRNDFMILPEYVCRKPRKSHVNLLLIKDKYSEESDLEDEDSSKRNYHYMWIKNMSRFFSNQLGVNRTTKLICNYCLYYSRNKKKFEEHMQTCHLRYTSPIRLPSKESCLINHFSSIKKVMKKKKAPFALYIDFKCRLKEDKQVPYSIGLYIMCSYDSSLSSYQFNRGDDCMQWFANALKGIIENVETVFVCDLPKAKMSKKNWKMYEENNRCYICEKPITKECKKVRNNCCFTGEFRGPAHEICNMNFRDHRTISVFVHNRRENDSFLLMEYLETKYFHRTEIDTRTRTKMKFISFVKYSDCVIKFRFINSFELINGDLDTLASNISEFPVLQSEMSEDQSALLNKKLIYPDDRYCTDPDRFSQNSLPPISDFEGASAEDYDHASRVWNEFKLSNFGEYSDLHLKRSILLLADVFEDFRGECLDEFELDPSYFHNLPDYSWDVMLRKTDVTFELLTDMDMFLFFEGGTRGGLSQCLIKYSKANNVSLENYNNQEEVKYLMHFDTSYLYEWAMCQYLPQGQFKWVEDFAGFDVESVLDEASIGYILEVDLNYADDIHYEHKDLPFCPEYENGRLKAKLNHKTNYIIHYRNLKQALKTGLRLTKIHRILEFKQSAWLKPYIERNMKLSAESEPNNFEKDLFERMNYGIFEYISKNIREQNRAKIYTKYENRFGVHDMVSKREFTSIDILNDECAYIEYKPSREVLIDHPIYLLMCVQDLAKTRIYDFHYDYMKKKFGEKCSVCYMENDSILYEIREENVYSAIKEDCKEHFNTSDYPSNNIWKIPQVNGTKLGMFKDRHSGRVLSEFVALRRKLYECKFDGRDKLSNNDSVAKQVDVKRITFEDYFLIYDNKNNVTK